MVAVEITAHGYARFIKDRGHAVEKICRPFQANLFVRVGIVEFRGAFERPVNHSLSPLVAEEFERT